MQTVGWKIILSIALFISFIFFSLSAVESLQNRDLPGWSDQVTLQKKQPLSPPVKEVRFYPPLPSRLPDLSEGYLFNEERKIQPTETTENIPTDDTTRIDVEEIQYAGSLIIGGARKGLIRYQVAATPLNRRGRVTVSRGQKTASAKWSSKVVEEGEKLSGYRVASITPEAIVFEQGGRQIEKMLFSPDKERIAYTPPMNRAMPAPKRAVSKTSRSYKPGTTARPPSTSSRVRTPAPSRVSPHK